MNRLDVRLDEPLRIPGLPHLRVPPPFGPQFHIVQNPQPEDAQKDEEDNIQFSVLQSAPPHPGFDWRPYRWFLGVVCALALALGTWLGAEQWHRPPQEVATAAMHSSVASSTRLTLEAVSPVNEAHVQSGSVIQAPAASPSVPTEKARASEPTVKVAFARAGALHRPIQPLKLKRWTTSEHRGTARAAPSRLDVQRSHVHASDYRAALQSTFAPLPPPTTVLIQLQRHPRLID